MDHLSDHSTVVQSLLDGLKPGIDLGEVIVLEKDEAKRKLMLSRKPSLIDGMKRGKLPGSIDELEEGEVYPGFVKNVEKYGVFVSFLNRTSGLAHKRSLADVFVAEPSEHFSKGQSVNDHRFWP